MIPRIIVIYEEYTLGPTLFSSSDPQANGTSSECASELPLAQTLAQLITLPPSPLCSSPNRCSTSG